MRVAVALGGGGARGYTHIGVLAELAARGHEVSAYAGTSMGAIIGGLAAAGGLDAFTEWARSLGQRDVLRLLDPALGEPGAIKAQRVMDRVAELLGGARIEELGVPYTAVATDLGTGREVWFTHGPVATAMRASIAIPSAITPVMINGRLLADGGLVNPVPMDPLAGSAADFTLAVNLAGRRAQGPSRRPVAVSADEAHPGLDWAERLRSGLLDNELVRRLRERFEPVPGVPDSDDPPDPFTFQQLPARLRTSDVLALSYDASQSMITRFRMAANPPDVIVTVPVDAATLFDFHRAAELIDLGRELAVAALDRAGY